MLESEDDSMEIEVKARAVEDEDYSPIVTEGEFKFIMKGLYPWVMDEVEGVRAARSTNMGVSDSASSLTSTVNVKDGQRGILSFSEFMIQDSEATTSCIFCWTVRMSTVLKKKAILKVR